MLWNQSVKKCKYLRFRGIEGNFHTGNGSGIKIAKRIVQSENTKKSDALPPGQADSGPLFSDELVFDS